MADKRLMVDSSILIDYFRKTDKAKVHLQFWNGMLERFAILNFDSKAARQAADVVAQLKLKRKTIDKPDLFIAATAIVHQLHLGTLNIKHFPHIDSLQVLAK